MKKVHKLNQQERKEFIIIFEYLSAADPEIVALGIGMLKSYCDEQNIYNKVYDNAMGGEIEIFYKCLNRSIKTYQILYNNLSTMPNDYLLYYSLVAVIKADIQMFIKYVLINDEYYYDYPETDINRT